MVCFGPVLILFWPYSPHPPIPQNPQIPSKKFLLKLPPSPLLFSLTPHPRAHPIVPPSPWHLPALLRSPYPCPTPARNPHNPRSPSLSLPRLDAPSSSPPLPPRPPRRFLVCYSLHRFPRPIPALTSVRLSIPPPAATSSLLAPRLPRRLPSPLPPTCTPSRSSPSAR